MSSDADKLLNFKEELMEAMGMSSAMATWIEAGGTGPNPGAQILMQANNMGNAINNYLRELGVAADSDEAVVKKP